MNITRLARLGDMVAIPLFAALAYYFWTLSKERPLTPFEKGLFLFAIGGFIADIIFVTYS